MRKIDIKLGLFIGLIVGLGLMVSCSKKVHPTKSEVKKSGDEQLEYDYAFTEATKQFVFGNVKQALVLYQKCIEANPKSAASYYQMSIIFSNVGEIDRALTYAKKAKELNKEEIWYKLNLANLYSSAGKADSAIIVFEEILDNNKDNIDYKFTLAKLYTEKGSFKKAVDLLEEIEESYGITEQVSIAKHQVYSKDGKEDQAIKAMENLIEYDPANVMYYGILAEYYSTIGKDKKAEELYEMILDLDDNNAFVYLSTGEHYSKKGDYEKAFEYYKKGIENKYLSTDEKVKTLIGIITNGKLVQLKYQHIKELIDDLVEEEPDNVRVRTLRADFHVRVNELELAERDLEHVLEFEKNNFVIWEQLLFIKNSLQKFETLLEYSSKAKEKFPNQPTVYMFKGIAEMQFDNHQEAVQTFQQGLKKSGENKDMKIQFYTFLGDAYRNTREHEKSDEAFEQVLSLDPDNIIVLNNYSYYLSLRKERLEEAKAFSKKTLDKEPNNPTYLDTYAWILYNMENYEDALKYIKKAYDNGGNDNPEILEHYGDILMKMGEKEEAVLYWKAAAILDKENMNLEEKIDMAE